MALGIEAINAYVGRACVDVRELFSRRGLSMARFDNLMMRQRSVGLPCEDPVTNAVNAAKPLVDTLSPAEREQVELVVVGTESGLDFGKSISTYVHHHLGLPARCRSFEVKHACYGGTAALRTAVGIVATSASPRARALVVATDAPSAVSRGSYWEPSEGAGAVAMLVGRQAGVLQLDQGASGFHTYEVMDTARPATDVDVVDPDVSLLAYLDCLEHSFAAYSAAVAGVDAVATFDGLVFHTPFAGMVKGAHRALLRRFHPLPPDEVEADFRARVAASLEYPGAVGNLFSASLYLALCSAIDHGPTDRPRRLGLFSYGSGCASEFYSGVVPAGAAELVGGMGVGKAVADRCELAVDEYDRLVEGLADSAFGTRDAVFDPARYGRVYDTRFDGRGLLVLDRIRDFHREYRWT
ncbi:hydroxymethylglutaryl-CoA synthase family protein [Saccharothrix coeruleofusca]|uniref:Hydroxymethylglutaryl-CoA synthase n=1 Tax=Saccharothrix coeruleofusca TaxID=33919 RepID=A0A918AL69_9PSEU|nr:hydroxymethylglutaryl-CoA synthase family protein [Saccharothrix coeruleofusca]GGP51575.1 hydroxymethylglutaryl-CoA synthase [Saccharothrix coeruleofusca]GGP84911.1 hydroxymethylglutaryl-CoA synthase [Saccharothrix coeruleofusca]